MQRPDEAKRALVRQWLGKAGQDLEAAQTLVSAEPPLFAPACFHAQQAGEKFLKAFLTWQQIEFRKTHSMGELLDLVERADAALAAALEDAVALTPYGVEVRYPGEAPEPSPAQALEALSLAREVRKAIENALLGAISD